MAAFGHVCNFRGSQISQSARYLRHPLKRLVCRIPGDYTLIASQRIWLAKERPTMAIISITKP